MVTVQIGQNERPLHDAGEDWIRQQVRARKSAGQLLCVRVKVRTDGANVALSTGACAGGGGGGRRPNRLEQRMLDLWDALGLLDSDVDEGGLNAFLKKLRDWL